MVQRIFTAAQEAENESGKQMAKSKSLNDEEQYKRAKREYNDSLKGTPTNYCSDFLRETPNDMKALFSAIQRLLGDNSERVLPSQYQNDEATSEAFVYFFHT